MGSRVKLNDIVYDIVGKINFDNSTYMVIIDSNNTLKYLDLRVDGSNIQYIFPNNSFDLRPDSDIRKLNEKNLVNLIAESLQNKLTTNSDYVCMLENSLMEINTFIKNDVKIRSFLYLNIEISPILFKQNVNEMLSWFTENIDNLLLPVKPKKIYQFKEEDEAKVNLGEFIQAKKEEQLEATIRIQKANYNKDILISALTDLRRPVLDEATIKELYSEDNLNLKQIEILEHQMEILDYNYKKAFVPRKPSLGITGFTNAILMAFITGSFAIICLGYMFINLS